MKVLDRCLIIVFNLCLLLVAVWVSAVPIAKNPAYYHFQFRVNDIYGSVDDNGDTIAHPLKYIGGTNKYAKYTDEQLDVIIDHIIDYLFNDKDDFALELENVEVSSRYYGEYELQEKVDVFGEKAITHMHDVKQLFIIYQIVFLHLLQINQIFFVILSSVCQIILQLPRFLPYKNLLKKQYHTFIITKVKE